MSQNPERRKIGIDKDDVLVNFTSSLQQFHNEQYGTNFTLNDVHNFNLWEVWQCSYEEAADRVTAFYKSGKIKTLLPMEGAREAVEILKQRFDLVIITSRPQEFTAETAYTTEKYFPGCFSGIYHTSLLLSEWGVRRKKSEICRETGAEILIDDSLDNVRDCASVGIRTLLFRRPWNLSVSDESLKREGIIPVRLWGGVTNYFKNRG